MVPKYNANKKTSLTNYNNCGINSSKTSVRFLLQVSCPATFPDYLGIIALPWASWLNGQTWALNGHFPSSFCPASLMSWSFWKNLVWAAFPLQLSRIWVNFSTNWPTLVQILNGQPSLKAGQLPARPLHSVTRIVYGHMALPKAGQLNMASFKVTPMGVLRRKNKNMCNKTSNLTE